jgi:hypothetical protein
MRYTSYSKSLLSNIIYAPYELFTKLNTVSKSYYGDSGPNIASTSVVLQLQNFDDTHTFSLAIKS